jgi:TPR repeat protein
MMAGFRRLFILSAAVVLVLAWAVPSAADEEARFGEALAAYDAGDYPTSFEIWHPMAEAGDTEAQMALAGLYLAGLGMPADAAEAARWYRRAAASGDPVAQLNLGDFHLKGLGVSRDPLLAYAWFSLAADQGRRWAALQRDELAERLTASELAEAQALAADLRPADE